MGWEDEHFPKRHQRTQEELERPPRDPFPGHSLKLPAGSEYCGTGGHPKRPDKGLGCCQKGKTGAPAKAPACRWPRRVTGRK